MKTYAKLSMKMQSCKIQDISINFLKNLVISSREKLVLVLKQIYMRLEQIFLAVAEEVSFCTMPLEAGRIFLALAAKVYTNPGSDISIKSATEVKF